MNQRLPVPPHAALELHPQYRFQWEEKQQCHVLLFPEGLIQLPGSAGKIIEQVDGTRTVDDIVKDLEASFPGVELKNDVVEFLEIAHAKGWIRAKTSQ